MELRVLSLLSPDQLNKIDELLYALLQSGWGTLTIKVRAGAVVLAEKTEQAKFD